MSPQAQLVMVLWIPIILYFFTRYPPSKAVMISFIGGSLFLPQRAGFLLPLIPDYTGMQATCYGIILGIIIYDAKRFSTLKVSWIDTPMILWCICPLFSSLANDLGLYDGFNQVMTQTVSWGLPYYIGRLYLKNLTEIKSLAILIVKGGLIYIPLVLYEARLSPVLHLKIYGYFAHESGISQSIRLGGYRPMVFMEHGLVVGMWMMSAAFVALWLWQAKAVKKIWGIPIAVVVFLLLVAFIACKSSGAYVYYLYGFIVLFTAQRLKTPLLLLLLMGGILLYLIFSVYDMFPHNVVIDFISKNFSVDRALSLKFRFDNELILSDKARERLLFGWGGWGRNRIYAEDWKGDLVDISVTDSLWIIAFGINGLVGLVGLVGSMLLPVTVFCLKGYPARTWFNPKVAPAAVSAVILVLYLLNSVLNAHLIPVFPLISGALTGLVGSRNQKPRTRVRTKVEMPNTKSLTSKRGNNSPRLR